MRPDSISDEFTPEVAAAAGSRWTDVSVSLRGGMRHLPWDPGATIARVRCLDDGEDFDATMLHLSAHAGTHIDAPRHFIEGGKTIDMVPFSVLMGPARVIEIRNPRCIKASELAMCNIRRGEKVLFKTRNSAQPWEERVQEEDYVHLTLGGATYLVEKEVRLVGIDYLTIGPPNSDTGAVHRVLLGAGVWIVEGLDLSQVSAGKFDLICLPLKLDGCEAAPARAILRPSP